MAYLFKFVTILFMATTLASVLFLVLEIEREIKRGKKTSIGYNKMS